MVKSVYSLFRPIRRHYSGHAKDCVLFLVSTVILLHTRDYKGTNASSLKAEGNKVGCKREDWQQAPSSILMPVEKSDDFIILTEEAR